MPVSTSIGVLILVVAVVFFALVGLLYFGGRRQGPPNGLNRNR